MFLWLEGEERSGDRDPANEMAGTKPGHFIGKAAADAPVRALRPEKRPISGQNPLAGRVFLLDTPDANQIAAAMSGTIGSLPRE